MENQQVGLPRIRGGLLPSDLLAVAYLALLGVLDAAVTAGFYHLETNPLVLDLGLLPWLALKVGLLAAFVVAYGLARGHRAAVPVLVVGAGVGLLAVGGNALVVLGVL